MLGDGTIDSWWRRVWPHGARRSKSPANDALFIDVMADFSRKLGERVARQSAGGLAGAAQERREALKAYDRSRRRQQILTGGVAVGALIALGIASLAPPTATPVAAPPAVAAAPSEPAPAVMVAAAQPTVLPDARRPTADGARSVEHGGAGRARAAARRRDAGSPEAAAGLRLQSRAGRRRRRAHDRRRRHELPAEQRPTAGRRHRPRSAGAASPGFRAPGGAAAAANGSTCADTDRRAPSRPVRSARALARIAGALTPPGHTRSRGIAQSHSR